MRIKSFVAAAAVCAGGLLSATTALADVPASQPAQQDTNFSADLVISMGSDTTYSLQQRLSTIYNGSEGCTQLGNAQGGGAVNGANSSTCKKAGGVPATTVNDDPLSTVNGGPGIVLSENYDHDVVTELFPTGSGNGINAVCNGTTVNNGLVPVIARSSRVRSGSDPCTGFSFWGYARDAVIPVFWPNLNNALSPLTNLSQTQAQQIFRNCTSATTTTDPATWIKWSDIQAGLPATPVRLWGIQSNSGTYASFNTWVGVDTVNWPGGANTCANLQSGQAANASGPRILFENDEQQIPAADRPNSLHFMSWGPQRSSVRLSAGSSTITPGTGSLTVSRVRSGAIPTSRDLFVVTRDVPTTDAQRAANDFASWLCANTDDTSAFTTAHNSLLGVLYGSAIDQSISALEGFVTRADNSATAGPRNTTTGTGKCVKG